MPRPAKVSRSGFIFFLCTVLCGAYSSSMSHFDFSATAKQLAAEAARCGDKKTFMAQFIARAAMLEFPNAVAKAGWHLLKPGVSFDPSSHEYAIVIGVAVWAPFELQCLSKLRERLGDQSAPVYVFDIDDCMIVDHTLFIPGTEPPLQTPILAEYRNGKLIHYAEGRKAAEWIKQK